MFLNGVTSDFKISILYTLNEQNKQSKLDFDLLSSYTHSKGKNSKVIFWGPKVNANDFFIIVMVEGWEPFCQNDFGFID